MNTKSNSIANGYCLYINLDRSVARKDRIVAKTINAIGIAYSRCPAIRDSSVPDEKYKGALGCLKSHHKAMGIALEKSKIESYKWFLIFEDDTIWNPEIKFEHIISRLEMIDMYLEHTPVVLLGSHINGPKPQIHPEFPDIKIALGTCNASHAYIVRSDYCQNLQDAWDISIPLFEKQVFNMIHGIPNDKPIWWHSADCYPWADMQKEDEWFHLQHEGLDLAVQANDSDEFSSTIDLSLQ